MSKDDSGIDDEAMIDIDRDNIIEYLNEILDKPVLIPIPYGQKGPKFEDWQKTTYETIRWKEVEQAIRKGGNLGILLGPVSGNLVTIDLDTDEEMDRFFEFAPWAKNTYITVGDDGCQCWFIIEGRYPAVRKPWKKEGGNPKGKPIVEFRGGGGVQSVTWGAHPTSGGRYTVNGKRPLHISYLELDEYRVLLEERDGVCDEEWQPGQQDKDNFEWTKKYKGCNLKELDLLGLLKYAGIRYRKIEEEELDTYAIECPWKNEHTTENAKRDAAVFVFKPRGRYWPAFSCFHVHCFDRELKDLLGWLQRERGIQLSTIKRYCGGGQRIEIEDDDVTEEPVLPDPIIDGLLYPELKMLMVSSSKIGKTWLGIDLAISLVTGGTWLGFDTCQTSVLYLNLEMPTLWFRQRIYQIKEARGIAELPKGMFKRANLRGASVLMDIDILKEALFEVCDKYGPFGVIIFDPVYKMLGDLDENKATDVGKMLSVIDSIGRATKAASVPIHHYAKGDAWQKRVGDRGSGSGVFLRDPDTYMGITELGEEDSGQARVDVRLRVSPRIGAFGIRWDNYRWKRDESIDITPKKRNKDGSPKPITATDIMVQILVDNPQGLTNTAWKKAALIDGVKEDNFNLTVRKLKEKGRIRQNGPLYLVGVV